MAKELTPDRTDFLAVYLSNGKNGTAAAMATGHSPDNPRSASVLASRWLAMPAMKAAIKRAEAREIVNIDNQLKPVVEQVKERLTKYALKEHPIEDITPDHSMKAADMILKSERAYHDNPVGIGGLLININVGER